MGACESCQEREIPPPRVRIYGDYLCQDTRALLSICKLAKEDHEFILIDTLKQENYAEAYREKNPNMTIPMIVYAGKYYIGQGDSLFNLLIQTCPNVV